MERYEIKRDHYLQIIIDRKENGMIKVITGIRRCAKSYLLFNNQSVLKTEDQEKLAAEIRPLKVTGDFFKQIIITKSSMKPQTDENGILHIGLYEFLLNENALEL